IHLSSPRDAERPWRHVARDRRAGGDVRPAADVHGRDELRVAADERLVLDHGLMLLLAVIVARDRAGADVDPFSDDRVPEITEVVGLRPGAENRVLQLDEVPDARLLADVAAGPQVRKRSDRRTRGDVR